MARRKPHGGHENHERWLVSYADFITLLFAFFVVMFASSQTDKAKASQVSESVKEALSKGGITAAVRELMGGTVDDKGKGNALMRGPGGARKAAKEAADMAAVELLPSLAYLTRELRDDIKAGKLQVSLQPRGLVVSLRQAAFFPSGEDTVDPASYPSLEKITQRLRTLPNAIRLEGHTDSVPIHTVRFPSNWELSAARGIAMMNLFVNRFSIPRDKMAIAGYADSVPIESNDTPEGRSKNRRVDVIVLNQYTAPPDEPLTEKAGPTLASSGKSGPSHSHQ
jgi:chemotaxis protein MotB